ncbi:MAG TPA: GxxExxY protein [Tepidisphaeraceae bacterium]|jgi:GxxExxY protein
MHTDEHRLNQLTELVIGCAYRVSNKLGSGFLEKVYENAMAVELQRAGIFFEQQKSIVVRYDGVVVGDYVADLLIEGVVLVELKACKGLDEIHEAQCLNYLKATRLPLCLLINLGKSRVEIKRFAGQAARLS